MLGLQVHIYYLGSSLVELPEDLSFNRAALPGGTLCNHSTGQAEAGLPHYLAQHCSNKTTEQAVKLFLS